MRGLHFAQFRRLLVGAAAVLIVLASQPARAALLYDLRLVGGSKVTDTVMMGSVIHLELYAEVTGVGLGLEGFQDGYVSILSSVGGNIRGDISGALTSDFSGNSSQAGTSQDLDGDGDKDLGSNLTIISTDFLFARSQSMQTSGLTITGGQEFKLADIYFTVTNILNPTGGSISLNARVTPFSTDDLEAVWQQDGAVVNPNPGGGGAFPTVGASVLVIPEPGSAALAVFGGLLFLRRHKRRTSLPATTAA